jgi:non-ribosomal peptide synthetase component F
VWQRVEREDELQGTVVYSTDLFDPGTIERLVGHFVTLLEGVVADVDQRISALPLLTEAERHQLVVEWNNTTVAYPREKCVHHLVEEQVERTPDAIAVVFEGQELTYRELNERANQFAHYLHSLGVGPKSLVGLCLERSLNLAIGILGILKVGGAYLPLDADDPYQRLEFLLQDAAIKHLVTQKALLDRLPANACGVTCVDVDAVKWDHCGRSNPAVEVVADNLAYVMYTSGSTGVPKGVAMPHAPLVNLIDWHRHDARLRQPARTLQFATCTFDVSFQEMLTTWSCGSVGGHHRGAGRAVIPAIRCTAAAGLDRKWR